METLSLRTHKRVIMTLDQFKYRHRDDKPDYAVWNQLPDMGVWGSLRLLERMDSCIDRNVQRRLMRDHRPLMTDLSLARNFSMYWRADELSKRVKELSDGYLRFSAAKFFTEHCGWSWGGASLGFRDVSFISGDYVLYDDEGYDRAPSVKTVRIPVAMMDVCRCGNRIRIPVMCACVEKPGARPSHPDVVADVLLYPILEDGALSGVLMSGYTECGREVLFSGKSSWDMLRIAAVDTRRYLTGEMYDAYRRLRKERQEKLRGNYWKNRWEREMYRHHEPPDRSGELDTLEALGYDTDDYIWDTYYWMF